VRGRNTLQDQSHAALLYYDDVSDASGASAHTLVYAGLLAAYELHGEAWLEHCYFYDRVSITRHQMCLFMMVVVGRSASEHEDVSLYRMTYGQTEGARAEGTCASMLSGGNWSTYAAGRCLCCWCLRQWC
jgi:hypothetical protein